MRVEIPCPEHPNDPEFHREDVKRIRLIHQTTKQEIEIKSAINGGFVVRTTKESL